MHEVDGSLHGSFAYREGAMQASGLDDEALLLIAMCSAIGRLLFADECREGSLTKASSKYAMQALHAAMETYLVAKAQTTEKANG